MPLKTWCHHTPQHLVACVTKPGVTECFSMVLPTGKSHLLPKSVQQVWKRWLLLQECRTSMQGYRIMKNQRNMTPALGYSKPLVTGPNEMEIQEFPDKVFKHKTWGRKIKDKSLCVWSKLICHEFKKDCYVCKRFQVSHKLNTKLKPTVTTYKRQRNES